MFKATPGDRVGGRYRLERQLGRSDQASTWEAFDERLDRPVAIRIFEQSSDRRALTKRAGLAASLTHPRVLRLFDTGFDAERFFTISELGSGSLAGVRLPLPGAEAHRVATEIAEALEHAHERGVVHGHLTEENVLLSSAGAKVGDFALGAEDADARNDLVAMGALLRRVVGAPVGPVPDDPPGFARIVEGLAEGAYDSSAQTLDDLRAIERPEVAAAEPARRRRWLILVAVPLVALAVFGVMQLGERSPRTRFDPAGRIEGVPLAIVDVEDFDPLGDDREGRLTVDKIADDNAQTFWSTERYREGPDFSGLKAGVGVIFDLGQPREVGKFQLLFPAAGCSYEIRFTDDRTTPVDAWTTLSTVDDSPPSAPLIFTPGAEARYWLLWITRLAGGVPGAGRAYACAVSEADLFAP